MKTTVDGLTKKPYTPPKLIVYGDLTEMTTLRMGTKGNPDGGKGNRRT